MSLLQAWRQTDRAQTLMIGVAQEIENENKEGTAHLAEKANNIYIDLQDLADRLEWKMTEVNDNDENPG